MHSLHVVGARPNFMKAAPVLHALRTRPAMRQTLVRTGQHYDKNLSIFSSRSWNFQPRTSISESGPYPCPPDRETS
jgi:UDP-N-acetylglucosamine 2-epimerase